MIEKNNIEPVWVIEDNKLKKANKVVSKIMYKNTEIAVLKTDRNCFCQDYLFKDSNNEYWSMGIIGFDFKKFISISVDDTLKDTKEYCDKVFNVISNFDLRNYFSEKISKQKYFNLCELKYISNYLPDLYENALNSRKIAKEKYDNRINEISKQVEKEHTEKVERVNGNFEKRLEDSLNIAVKVLNGKRILVYRYNHITYRLSYDEICYVIKDGVEKKCIIVTDNGKKFLIGSSLKEMLEKLKPFFIQTHKSCIINLNKIKEINASSNEIILKNGKTLNFLSRTYKTKLEEKLKM